MASWCMEIKKHVNRGMRNEVISVELYHGNSRKSTMELIANNRVDVVLTTYHTLACEMAQRANANDEENSPEAPGAKKQKMLSIFDIHLHRIVLDEAHIIRNVKTSFFKAVTNLQSTYKLALTGTPYMNRPQDLHSLFAFLGIQPLGNVAAFRSLVATPISEHREIGLARIRATLSYVSITREKSKVMSSLSLPPKTIEHSSIPMTEGKHKSIHDILYESARSLFVHMLNISDELATQNFMMLIELVLRIRQSLCHVSLVPTERRAAAEKMFQHIIKHKDSVLDPEEAQEMLERLTRICAESSEEEFECAICLDAADRGNIATLKTCKHTFCQTCIQSIENRFCPLCRKEYRESDIISYSSAERVASQTATIEQRKQVIKEATEFERSPKLQYMLDLIKQMKPDEKAVIFSQWTSHLDIIQRELRSEGYTYCRIDGSMSPKDRVRAMEMFETNGTHSMETPRFMLCSLMAAGVGVTLTRANVAFLCDPWWNEASENQAMDRIHRIGQKRDVRVYRLLMKDSLEERLVRLQDQKATLGKGSLRKLSREELSKARLTMMKDLFQVEDHQTVWM